MIAGLILPYPPTINHYYTRTKHGCFINGKGTMFRQQVASAVFGYIASHKLPLREALITGDIEMDIMMYLPDNRKRDIDNILKATLDAITHVKDFVSCKGIWNDDKQIAKLSITKIPRCDHNYSNGMLIINIKPID